MKKTLATLVFAGVLGTSSLFAQDPLENLSISTTFGWESSYMFRGAELALGTFQASVDASFTAGPGDLYIGIWTAQPTDDLEVDGSEFGGISGRYPIGSEIDVYAGYAFVVADIVTLDAGVTVYYYPEEFSITFEDAETEGETTSAVFEEDNTTEAYFGASFDVPVSPSIYVFYDFDLENFTLEAAGGHSFPIGDSGLSVDIGGFVGWVSIGEEENEIVTGETIVPPETEGGESMTVVESEDTYWYAGITGDLVYTFNDYASISGGIRYSYASEDIADLEDPDEDNFWYGFAFTAGF